MKKKSPVLLYNLKNVECLSFQDNTLKLLAKTTEYEYLKDKNQNQKVLEFLNKYTNINEWKLDLELLKTGSLNSIKELEVKEKHAQKEEMIDKISKSPVIKSLKKAFPGSTLTGL